MKNRIAWLVFVFTIGLTGWAYFHPNPLVGVWQGQMFAQPTNVDILGEGSFVQIEFFGDGHYEYDQQGCTVGGGSYRVFMDNSQMKLEIKSLVNQPSIFYDVFMSEEHINLIDEQGRTFFYKKLPKRLPYGFR